MMIFGPSARDATAPQANPARLVNCFREPGQRTLLRAIEGLSVYANTGSTLAGDMMDFDGDTYAIFGETLFKLPGETVAALAPGEQYLARNATALTIVSGGRYFVWDGGALTEPTGIFAGYGSVTYLAGRTILSEADGNRFEWSDIAAPETLNGLNFASAEQRDDKLLRVMTINGQLMAFGERSTEIWSATGSGGAAAFALLPGAVVDIGLKARKLAVDVGGGAFIVGDDNIAYLAASTQWQPVSIPAVNVALRDGNPQRCLYWESLGHKFAAITFLDRPAWVYDLATTEWFERAIGRGDPWSIAMSCPRGGSWLFGATNGKVYEPGSVTDMGKTLYHEATSALIEQGDYFTVNEIEFGASYGFQTDVATMELETSRDGATWSRQGSVDLGQDGDFMRRAVFRRIGTSRKRAFRVSWTGDMSLYADAMVK
jgi:hypothetical protein